MPTGLPCTGSEARLLALVQQGRRNASRCRKHPRVLFEHTISEFEEFRRARRSDNLIGPQRCLCQFCKLLVEYGVHNHEFTPVGQNRIVRRNEHTIRRGGLI